MNMGTMNIVMSLMMGFMALRFPSLLVIYWVLGGVIQLITTYFINYRPAMQKKRAVEAVEAEKEACLLYTSHHIYLAYRLLFYDFLTEYFSR